MSGWNGSTRRSRLPPNWDSLRVTVLRRDPTCRHPGCPARSTDVDHVIANDDHRLTNLQGLCNPHHVEKTNRERPHRGTNRRPPERHPGGIR